MSDFRSEERPPDSEGGRHHSHEQAPGSPAGGFRATAPQAALRGDTGHLEGPPRTGDPAVDAALAAAAAAQDAAPDEQLETYVGTHRALQDRLADSGA